MTDKPVTDKLVSDQSVSDQSVSDQSVSDHRSKLASKICVLYCGGTMGMVEGDAGQLVPDSEFLPTYLRAMPELASPRLPNFDFLCLDPVLDSADVGPRDWVRMATEVASRYDDYTGFVIVHGTDTMAYSASALSFLLPGLSKPVVFTGSQLSLIHPRSDGREHLITSMIVASRFDLPEVMIYFGSRLMRGNRAQKINSQEFVAFNSGNLPPLAKMGTTISVHQNLVREAGSGVPSHIRLTHEPKVAAIRLFPGMQPEFLAQLLATKPDGIILETYGAGTAPSKNPRLLEVLKHAICERNLIVVSCSQCHGGAVLPFAYEAGAGLAKAGVISGLDMTPESALTKLYVLLASGLQVEDVKQMMRESLAGELTTEAEHKRALLEHRRPRKDQQS